MPTDASLLGRIIADGVDFKRSNLSLTYEDEEGNSGESFRTRPTEEGDYEFSHIPSGTANLLIEFYAGSVRQNAVTLEIAEGEENEFDFDIDTGASIVGSIKGVEEAAEVFSALLRGEMEIKELSLVLYMKMRTKVAAIVQTEEDGSFTILGLDPGTYTLVAVAFDEKVTGFPDFTKARFTTAVVTLAEEEKKQVELTVPQL